MSDGRRIAWVSTSGGVDNIKDFLMYFDNLMAWRSEYSDDVFDKLNTRPKIVVFTEESMALEIDAE